MKFRYIPPQVEIVLLGSDVIMTSDPIKDGVTGDTTP